jgi:hypothetical protein
MGDGRENEDLTIEIDPKIYERLALIGIRLGRDDVTEFINDMLYYELKQREVATTSTLLQ